MLASSGRAKIPPRVAELVFGSVAARRRLHAAEYTSRSRAMRVFRSFNSLGIVELATGARILAPGLVVDMAS